MAGFSYGVESESLALECRKRQNPQFLLNPCRELQLETPYAQRKVIAYVADVMDNRLLKGSNLSAGMI